jgi:Flp pilus assembly protein TadG
MLKGPGQFRRAQSGMAAVEFALIAPFLMALFFGLVEVCNALNAHQKVTSVASTAADLVSQATKISKSDLDDVFAASADIMTPFSNANTTIVITSLAGTGTKNVGRVLWSQASVPGATTHPVGSTLQIGSTTADASLDASVDGLLPSTCTDETACTIIMAEASYNYTSPYGNLIVGTMKMEDQFYAKPRRVISVECSDCDN